MPHPHQIGSVFTRFRPERTTVRAVVIVALLFAAGTLGFVLIEGWSVSQSFFFTVITLTTIGYGDYGLSPVGQNFTTGLIIVGLSTFAYFAGQILPALFNPTLYRNRRMHHQINQLSDHFIVCGLGRIGRSVCARLNRENVKFVVIDTDEKAVEQAREHGMLAVHGDATEDDLLEEMGIARARGLVCVTSSDTENIVITLGARELNPALIIISRAEQDDTSRKLQRAGATRIISPSHSSGQSIVNAILKPHLADLLEHSYRLDSSFVFSEVAICKGTSLVGETINACAERHGDVAFVAHKQAGSPLRVRPRGEDALREGDVLIVAGDQHLLNQLQDEATTLRSAA